MQSGPLTQALKEWQVAIDALIDGETIVLMRKGGIREAQGRFAVPARQALLYPTREHQKPELLKSRYADRVQPVASGWHPQQIEIRAVATITDVLPIMTQTTLAALLPWHIWNESLATARWQWKPHTPLLILCLRVCRLAQPQTIVYQSSYGGCRSWINLAHPVEIADATPVLSEAKYAAQVAVIKTICAADSAN